MSARVLEVVTFSTAAGTGQAEFIRAAEQASAVLRQFPGFLNRRMSKTEGGQWMDIVEWTDAGSAASAAKLFHTIEEAKPFCGMIDMASMKMEHHELVTAA